PCQVYYRFIGTFDRRASPLISFHGGPRAGHESFLALADLGVLLIPYEQQGCGKSVYFPEKTSDASFWSAQFFLDEFRTVLQHLGVRRNHILEGV
ncbi:hypothetical protein F5050DRAFT_1571993, partial [Lentinula boryana]